MLPFTKPLHKHLIYTSHNNNVNVIIGYIYIIIGIICNIIDIINNMTNMMISLLQKKILRLA